MRGRKHKGMARNISLHVTNKILAHLSATVGISNGFFLNRQAVYIDFHSNQESIIPGFLKRNSLGIYRIVGTHLVGHFLP